MPDDLIARIEEYNQRHEGKELDLGKILEKSLHGKLKEIESDTKFCCICKKIKPNDQFNLTRNPTHLRQYCNECSNKASEYQRRWKFDGNWKLAVDRTNGKCAVCGERFKDVHHIDPIDETEKRNDSKNLVALCRSCHLKAHNGAFSNIKIMNPEFLAIFRSMGLNG